MKEIQGLAERPKGQKETACGLSASPEEAETNPSQKTLLCKSLRETKIPTKVRERESFALIK
jgi:hypothetical protein